MIHKNPQWKLLSENDESGILSNVLENGKQNTEANKLYSEHKKY